MKELSRIEKEARTWIVVYPLACLAAILVLVVVLSLSSCATPGGAPGMSDQGPNWTAIAAISTSFLALVATTQMIWSGIMIRRDRRRAKVDLALSRRNPSVNVTMTNVGRRDLVCSEITAAFPRISDPRRENLFKELLPGLVLREGESKTLPLPHLYGAVREVKRVYLRDSTGKEWPAPRRALKRVQREAEHRVYPGQTSAKNELDDLTEPEPRSSQTGEQGDEGMKDMLISLYEQNEIYHQVKERMAWQALAIYLGFSLLLMSWLYSSSSAWTTGLWYVVAMFASVFAFVPALCFVRSQVILKALSVSKAGVYLDLFERNPSPTEEQVSSCLKELKRIGELRHGSERCQIVKEAGWPGTWALIAIGLFFVFQLGFELILMLCSSTAARPGV